MHNKQSNDSEQVDLIEFARSVAPYIDFTPFHANYFTVLNAFARGQIRRLIVTIPPQHGKSVGASVVLPAYMLGIAPDLRIAIASYSSSLANKFNRRVQRIIDSKEYAAIFPATTIKSSRSKSADSANYIRTSDLAEIVGTGGEILSVGREGALTGNQVDIFILDDLYKDAMEGNSPTVRENCWEWYTSVVKTRMHNNSSELIVFTRWHEEDLIGMIAQKEPVQKLDCWSQIDNGFDGWYHLNFEAIKESPFTEIDPRAEGDPLWGERHSRKLLLAKRNLDPVRFNCMYQGRPSSKEGLLYGDNFQTYTALPHNITKRSNYTDTADTGDDYLCSMCYEMGVDDMIYITDVVYSREPMEITERLVAEMLVRNNTRNALVESNNGGRGFARAISRLTSLPRVEWFHQSANKEARILSNSATVLSRVLLPSDWRLRWGDLHAHLTSYRRNYGSNRWYDAPDVITGIIEREIVDTLSKKIKAIVFSG